MKHLRSYNESDNSFRNYADRVILKELEKSWTPDKNLMEHWSYKYDHKLSNGYVISIIGLKSRSSDTMILYLNVGDKLSMIDYVVEPYNKRNSELRSSEEKDPKAILEWCIKTGEEQSQFYIERESLPTDDELRDAFIELSEDMGYVLTDIKYGYTNEPFVKAKPEFDGKTLFEINEDPYSNRSHRSSDHTKLVMYYEQPRGRGLEVSRDELSKEFSHLKERLNIFGYNVKCNMYLTQTRYYSSEHRPEDFIIVIENTRATNRIENRKVLRNKRRLNESFWKDTPTVDTISDICQDLKDDGYEIDIKQNLSHSRTYEYKNKFYIKGGFITITVSKEEDYLDGYTLVPFSFVKVKETFTRMMNFMKEEGYEYDLCYLKRKMSHESWVSFSGKDDTKHESYQITFYKRST